MFSLPSRSADDVSHACLPADTGTHAEATTGLPGWHADAQYLVLQLVPAAQALMSTADTDMISSDALIVFWRVVCACDYVV